MQLEEALKLAKEAVESAELPADWQPTAFKVSLGYLLGTLAVSPGNQSVPASPGNAPGNAEPSTHTANEGVQKFASRVKVPVPALEDVYEFDEELVRLHVGAAKISTSKSQAAREVAILVAAARQGTGLDDGWTATSHIRQALTDYGRLDASNFAANMKKVSDAFNFRGKGAATEVRLTQPGWEIAAQMVRKVAGVAE